MTTVRYGLHTKHPAMRKRILKSFPSVAPPATGELDVAAIATVLVTPEMAGHPVENAFDGRHGPGASRGVSETGGEQAVMLAFDAPQGIRMVSLEIEETGPFGPASPRSCRGNSGGRL
jgi:hypothetical protein